MTKEIKDFGEKIGGAKKDLWKERGFEIGDLDDMTTREYEEYVKKANVWAVPNFKKEVEAGMSPIVAYYIKKFRDMTPATPRPNARSKEYVEIFVNTLNIYKSEIAKIHTPEDILGLPDRIRDRMIDEGVTIYREYSKPLNSLRYDEHDLKKLRFKTELQNFPEEYTGALSGVEVFGGEFSRASGRSSGYIYNQGNGYYATKGRRIVVPDCATQEELKEKLEIWGNKKSVAKSKAVTKRIERPKVERLRPTGPDYRKGGDVSGEDYLETFKLRGGEFGNWNSQTERQEFLNLGYDAFKDLARAAEIPDSLISLGGYEDQKLAIAFGARGSGRAKAHYEPTKVVINLTKKKGAGSLAHEWGHALDDFIGIKTKDVHMLSNKRLYSRDTDKHPEIIEAFKGVMDAITERPRTVKEVESRRDREVKKFERDIEIRASRLTRVYDATIEQAQKLAVAREKFLKDPTEEGVDKISDLVKGISGRLPAKSHRDGIKDYIRYYKPEPAEAGEVVTGVQGTERSNYVTEAIRMDKTRSKGYYVKYEELFARAFESYIEDELEAQGIESNYLVYGTKNEMYKDVIIDINDREGVKPYPEGDERERINAAFRVLMVQVVRAFGTDLTEEEQAVEEQERKAKFMIVEFKTACKERDLDPDMGETEERDGKYYIQLRKGATKVVEVPKNTIGATEATLKSDEPDVVYEYIKPDEEFYDYDALADYIVSINDREKEQVDIEGVIAGLKELGIEGKLDEEVTGRTDIIDIHTKNRGITGLQLNPWADIEGVYAIHREEGKTIWGKWEAGEYSTEEILTEVEKVMEQEEVENTTEEVEDIVAEEETTEVEEEQVTEVEEQKEINIARIKQLLYNKVKVVETVKTDEAVMLVFDNGIVMKTMRYIQKIDQANFEYAGEKESIKVIEGEEFRYDIIAAKVIEIGNRIALEIEEPKDLGENRETRLESLKKTVQDSGMRLTVLKGNVGVFYYPAKQGEKRNILQAGFPQRSIFSHAKTRFGHSKDSVEAMARREKGELLEIKVDLGAIMFDKETGLFATRVPIEYKQGIWVEKGTQREPKQVLKVQIQQAAGVTRGTGIMGPDVIERMIAEKGISIHYKEIPKEHRNGNTKSWAITKGQDILIQPNIEGEKLIEAMIESYVHIKLSEKGIEGAKRVMMREGVAYIMGIANGLKMEKYCETKAFKMLEDKGQESVQNYIEQIVKEYSAIGL